MTMRIAIIGSGMAGLSCADVLVAGGHKVALFDKGRGPGGRMSTRRATVDGRTLHFDHGAQYFTARDPAFAAQAAAWDAACIAARWPAAGPDAWVGTPGMNAPVRAMAAGHDVSWGVRVEALVPADGGWTLTGADTAGRFDAVVVATPAEQVSPLLAAYRPDFAAAAERTPSAPCWTAMIAFDAALADAPAIVRHAGAIGWAARDGSKPGHGGGETWVVQATPDWSIAHLEEDAEGVAAALLAALADTLGRDLPQPAHLSAHRWRYARSGVVDGPGLLWDADTKLGACGDWLLAPRVEAAWLSGRALATAIGPA